MTVQNKYRIRIPVDVDQTEPSRHVRIAKRDIVLDVFASNPAVAVDIVTRAIEQVVAGEASVWTCGGCHQPIVPPHTCPKVAEEPPCHPGAACSRPEPRFDGKAALEAKVADLAAENARLVTRHDAWRESAESRGVELNEIADVTGHLGLTAIEAVRRLRIERDEARAKLRDAEAQVARLSAFGETVHRVRALVNEAPYVGVVGRGDGTAGGVFVCKSNPYGVMGTGGGG